MPTPAKTISPLFSAALRPDRRLHIAGGWVGLGVAAMVAGPLVVAMPALALPVTAAFLVGAAVLLVLSLRQARQRRLVQQVTLWSDQLEVMVTDAGGARTLRRFDPALVRLVLHRDEDEKTLGLVLNIGSERLELGDFLSPVDKASFAKAFGTALRKARAAGQNRVA